MKRCLNLILLISMLLTLVGCSSSIKTETHYKSETTENGSTSTYTKDEIYFKDENKLKITVEGYGDNYIDVSVKSTDIGDDAWIGLCPSSKDYETVRGANESAVLKEEISSETTNVKLNLKGLKVGEYYLVAVLDSKDLDAKTYVSDLFAMQ